MKLNKYIALSVVLVFLAGCAGMTFGYKDPDKGVLVTCVTEADVSKCSYIGADGVEVFVDAPVLGEPVEPK